MGLVDQFVRFTIAFWNLIVRILYLPGAVLGWVVQIAQSWKLILVLSALGGTSFLASKYLPLTLTEVEFTFRCRINPFYQEIVYPILSGIIREFYNRIICWFDIAIWFPYGYIRNVVYPTLREGGFGGVVTSFARYVGAIGKDVMVFYLANGDFLNLPLDLTNVHNKWIDFWEKWQVLLCFGCNDLCPYLTKLPIFPSFIGSDQMKDPDFLKSIEHFINGWIYAFQQIIYLLQEIIWPTQPVLPRPNFKGSFDFWCMSSKSFWKSWEAALQTFWETFLPYQFIWDGILCFFAEYTCAVLEIMFVFVDALVHADKILTFFNGSDQTYWRTNVKYGFRNAINIIAPPGYFAPIPAFNTNITHYQLLNTDQTTPEGTMNPQFGKRTVAECLCETVTRVICDPLNDGTTCQQQFNGTLLAQFDVCCFGNEFLAFQSNFATALFEMTLHVQSANDFIMATDRQPFTSLLKFNFANSLGCLYGIFKVVKNYGFCISQVLYELTVFLSCSVELIFRILVAALTLPYFELYLPGQCNFISCPGDVALNMALEFLNRVADASNPDGLINCLCFLLNSGFKVPFANCPVANSTFGCKATGYVEPSAKRSVQLPMTGHYTRRLTPILTYGDQTVFQFTLDSKDYFKAKDAFKTAFTQMNTNMEDIFHKWDNKPCTGGRGGGGGGGSTCPAGSAGSAGSAGYAGTAGRTTEHLSSFSDRLVTQEPVNTSFVCDDPLDPPPCFNLCCLPVKIIQLLAHTLAFLARVLNATIQTRSAEGSTYFNGKACPASDCFQSDLTMFIVKLIAPIQCLCEFIKLVLPPAGYADPCCAFTVAGELISCFFQIIINVGNSVAGDAPNYTYIKDPRYLVGDFNIVLEIALTLFDCVCNFITIIFGFVLSGITKTHKAIDICCTFRVQFKTILFALKLLFRLVISLATLESMESQCYLYIRGPSIMERPNCAIAIYDLPIMQDFRAITAAFLNPPSEARMNTCAVTTPLDGNDPKTEGVSTCLCNTINAILAAVFKFLQNGFINIGVIDDTTDPTCVINLCCFLHRGAAFIKDVADFLAQAIASIWQNWQSKRIRIGNAFETFYIPQATIDFLFCDEYGPEAYFNGVLDAGLINLPGSGNVGTLTQNSCVPGHCPNPNGTMGIVNANYDPSNPAQRLAKCGKLEPALRSLTYLLGSCFCSSRSNNTINTNGVNHVNTCGINNPEANGVANILDALLRWMIGWISLNSNLFPFQLVWPSCLCCGGPNSSPMRGILKPAALVIVVAARQVVQLIRNIPNPSYWSGQTVSFATGWDGVNGAISALADNIEDIRKTWINRFLAPFADALCNLLTNSACLLAMVLGNTCDQDRYMVISSAFTYFAAGVIRLIALIEGAVKLIAMELPGQCVGNQQDSAGNANDPDTQGSTGNGELIPTCSPNGANPIPYGKINGNQIGRVLVSLLTFIADATIGLGRLGCTHVCPGLGSTLPSVNLQKNQTCSCYNKTPYVGVGGGVCSYPTCQYYFNDGKEGEFQCPTNPNATFCSLADSVMSPNTGGNQFVNVFYGGGLEFAQKTGHCAIGCSNDTAVREQGEIWQPAGNTNWETVYSQYPYVPVLDPLQESGLSCKITNPAFLTDGNARSKAEGFFGKNYNPGILIPTFPNSNCYQDLIIFPYEPYNKYKCAPTNAYNLARLLYGQTEADRQCQWCLARNTSSIVIKDDSTTGPVEQQPVCNRDWCVSKGWCKNDQMVPCFPGSPVLDGIIITALKYIRCLLNELYGGFLAPVFDMLLGVLIFLWQLSGGIIRFAVNIFILAFNFLTRIPFVNFFLAVPDLLNLFGSFFAIFTQPVVFTNGRRGTSANSMENMNQDALRNQVEFFFGYDDGHDCVNADPVYCFCRVLNMGYVCKVEPNTGKVIPNNITIDMVLDYVRDHLGGQTSCDMLYSNLADSDIVSWVNDVSYAKRHEAIQCLTLRAQSERWNTASHSIPSNFFYNPKGPLLLYDSIVNRFKKFIHEDHEFQQEARKKRADGFQKRFGASRNDFYRSINVRGNMVKSYYQEKVGIGLESPVLWPLMNLDMYYYKYRMGYFHYLMEKAIVNYDGDAFFGSLKENIDDAIEGLKEIKQGFERSRVPNMIKDFTFHATDAFTKLTRRDLRKETKKEEEEEFVLPRWVSMESLRNLIQFSFPVFVIPRVEFGFKDWELETFSWNWREYDWKTPKLTRVHNTFYRMFYRISDYIWPHYTTREMHERFILDGNCTLVDGGVKLASNLVNYCLNDFVENLPNGTKRGSVYKHVRGYLDEVSEYQDHHYFYRNMQMEGKNYRRRRIVYPEATKKHKLDSKMYRRVVNPQLTGIENIIVGWIDDIFGINTIQVLTDFFNDFKAWVANPNVDPALYPNVGAKYWITFPIRCEFPENLDCSIGIGLGEALWKVGLVYLLVILILSIIFPGFLSFMSMIINVIVYFLIVFAFAWHYSPACIALFPSAQLGPGISLPILPVPINILPTLPMCLWDQVLEVMGEIIAPCYDWIPSAWVNSVGGVCPMCDEKINIVECTDVGITNALDVTLYWGTKIFGDGFCEWARGFSTNRVAEWLPEFKGLIHDKCMELKNVSPTQAERQEMCAYFSITGIAWIVLGLFLIGTFVITVGLALINVFHGFLLIIPTLPFYDALTNMGSTSNAGSFEMDGENDQAEEEEEEGGEEGGEKKKKKTGNDSIGYLAGKLKSWFITPKKEKKE